MLTAALEARILAKTQQRPPDGSTHWSTRKLARLLKIHHNHVQTAWTRAGLQPHRFERYMRSDDPDFEPKAADVIGLYLQPPQHAAVFAADEKTAIQALDRLDPVLPLSPGRAERHGFEYYRHGTLSLFAAEYEEGRGARKTVPRHTRAAFVSFWRIVAVSLSARDHGFSTFAKTDAERDASSRPTARASPLHNGTTASAQQRLVRPRARLRPGHLTSGRPARQIAGHRITTTSRKTSMDVLCPMRASCSHQAVRPLVDCPRQCNVDSDAAPGWQGATTSIPGVSRG